MTEVFIVLISTHSLNSGVRVGAVYATLTEATREVERLREANKHTKAWWISRWLVEDERK